MIGIIAFALAAQNSNRFLSVKPFDGLPAIKVDYRYAGTSFADTAGRMHRVQGRVIWIDGTANLDRINSAEKIHALLSKIDEVGFNTVVLDVKPIVGRTLYPSSLTEQMTAWKGQTMPAGFDPVIVFRREASRLGLSFCVSLNAFSEGHSYAKRDEGKADSLFGDPGWGYKHPELQTVVYRRDGLKPAGDGQTQIPLMMNPFDPQVQQRVLSFVREVAEKYAPDAMLFDDRYRFHGLDSDFSPIAKALFEAAMKTSLKWPEDVYRYTEKGIEPGPFFDDWLAFRADHLSRFMGDVRLTLAKASPKTQLGIYAGSWYGDYAKYGSNYASTALQAGFPFLTSHYRATGLAPKLDLLITGCYYRVATQFDALKLGAPIGQTVEAAGIVSDRVVRDQCWVYGGLQLIDFKDNPRGLENALQSLAATTQGVMVFDLSHGIDDFWPVFARAFRDRLSAPHNNPNLLETVRKNRKEWDKSGKKDRPFPILEGTPGTGF